MTQDAKRRMITSGTIAVTGKWTFHSSSWLSLYSDNSDRSEQSKASLTFDEFRFVCFFHCFFLSLFWPYC